MEKIKYFLKKIWDATKYILKEYFGFTNLVVLFNIGYLVYFVERMFYFYETTGAIPYELIVPIVGVFGGELTLTALITIFKRKYGMNITKPKQDSSIEMNGDDSVG